MSQAQPSPNTTSQEQIPVPCLPLTENLFSVILSVHTETMQDQRDESLGLPKTHLILEDREFALSAFHLLAQEPPIIASIY